MLALQQHTVANRQYEVGYGVKRGGIAQLGERLHGMQEVSGSIPLTSTNTLKCGSGLVAVVK